MFCDRRLHTKMKRNEELKRINPRWPFFECPIHKTRLNHLKQKDRKTHPKFYIIRVLITILWDVYSEGSLILKKKMAENWSFHRLGSRRLQECNVFHSAAHIKWKKYCLQMLLQFRQLLDCKRHMTDCPSLILPKLLDVALITIILRIPKPAVYRL